MKIVVGSDFHIGNKRLSHDNFLLNVETYLYPELRDCDVFIIAGDFFDRMLKLDEKATHVAVKVINDILEIGQINKMAIRVLRGTFTHDKNQNELFWTLAEGMDIDLDYISSLSISTIKKEMRLKVLYIPDNLVYQSSSDCIAAIKELLRNANWDKVDFVVGHGYFQHVLPKNIPHEPKCTFRVDQFNDIVKYYILMGHVHTPSKYANCYYCGSFERLAHGEEENKGFLTLTYDKDTDKWFVKRIWNLDTTPFFTIYLSDAKSYEENCKILVSEVERKFTPKLWGYLRIKCDDTDLRQRLESFAMNKWCNQLYISSISSKQEQLKEKYIPYELEFETSTLVEPTLDNICELTFSHLANCGKTNGLTLETITTYMGELIEQVHSNVPQTSTNTSN